MRSIFAPKRPKANYEGAGAGRRSRSWRVGGGGPDSLGDLGSLINRSRAAVRNDPYGASVINGLVSNTIGTGITPKPMHEDENIRKALLLLWDDWADEADVDGRTDFYGLQALIARAVYTDGECFVRVCPVDAKQGAAVPLQLQVLEAEFVPRNENRTLADGHYIRAGIEFDAKHRRIAYWVYRSHPGDITPGLTHNVPVRVKAEEILHIYEPLRPGQTRGVPTLAPVLTRMKTLDDFDDAVLFRQQVANLFAGFIRKPAPEEPGFDPLAGEPVKPDADGHTPMVGLEPGSMQELLPGEEVEFSDPPDAGNSYSDFMRQQLLAIAAGAGIPFEVLTGDMREVNDRVIRVVLNEFRRKIEQRQWNVFIHQLCRPVRAAWLDMAVLSGAIALPDYVANRRVYLRTRWVPQGFAYIHPVQDVQAQRMAIQAGITSRSESVLKQGYDAEMIDAEQHEDNSRADRLGLAYTSDGRQEINKRGRVSDDIAPSNIHKEES
ncbi:MAG: phage portal protein [Betaproteobacteria bacterium]|nr:phage portal protein [Betaproteobacteria bacterium]